MYDDAPLEQQLPDGSVLAFTSDEDFRSFVAREREFWEWLRSAAGGHQAFRGPAGHIAHRLSELSAIGDRLAALPDDEVVRADTLNELTSSLHALATEGSWAPATDPRAQYARSLAAAGPDPLVGAFTWLAFTKPQALPVNAPQAIQGVINAWLYEHGLSAERAAAEKQALSEARSEWDGFSSESKEEFSTFRSDFRDLQTRIAGLNKAQEERFESLLKQSGEALKSISETYDAKLALQAPVEYWQKRADDHKKRAKSFAWVFALGVVIVLVALGVVSSVVLPELSSGTLGGDGEMPYGRIALLIALGGLFVWPIRIVSRLLLSNLHLWTDAEERVTMVKTYLSLLRSDSGLDDSDRTLILNAMFRQSATGIVKDDGLGVSATALSSRLTSGGS